MKTTSAGRFLDVYKRQVDEARFNALVQKLRDAKEAPILPAAAPKVVELAAKEFNIRPVSYTHLDVYKRQVLY